MKAHYIGVSAVEKSANSKIGTVSATYVAQQSCPKTCPFLKSGCYAENGNTGFQTNRLNREAESISNPTSWAMAQYKIINGDNYMTNMLAQNEAAAIDGLTGQLPLRLHVVGDCTTNSAANTVAIAAYEYQQKHGKAVWTYTHGWRNVARSSWVDISVLASTETTQDAHKAMVLGYAAAIVVREHKDVKAYEQDGLKIIPCPEQTGKSKNCESCRLCWNDRSLRERKAVIAFATHGATKKANNALTQIEMKGGN